MTADGLREFMHARPFQPFQVRLPSGESVLVRHPDFIALSPTGRRATVYGDRGGHHMLDVLLIEALVVSGDAIGGDVTSGDGEEA